jgi:leader peptidase (prepilin peptidase)/N-methyltransferase
MTIEQLQLAITLIPLSYLAGAVIPITLSDVRENRVPNKIVVPLMIVTLLCWLTLAIWQGEWLKFGISILLFVAITFAGLALNHKFNVMGMGDIKLIATLSMILAWFSWGLALAFLPVVLVLALALGFLAVILTEITTLKLSPVVFATFGILLAVALT